MYGIFVMQVVYGDQNGQEFMSHYDENWIGHTLFIVVDHTHRCQRYPRAER